MRSAHLKCLSKAKVKQRWSGNSTYRSRYWNLFWSWMKNSSLHCCNSPYRLRYWNVPGRRLPASTWGCNSVYRSRYAPQSARQQRSRATMRSAHLKYLSKAKVKQRWWGNSPYCLRYAQKGARQQRSEVTMRSAHLKYLNEVKVKQSWSGNRIYRLRYWNFSNSLKHILSICTLQQYLPFTVLKPSFVEEL